MRAAGVTTAVIAFFALASVGVACDVPPMVCATRALVGAGVMYVLAIVLQRVVFGIMVDLMAGRTRTTNPSEEHTR